MATTVSTTLTADIFALITGDTPHLALYTSNPTTADTGTEVTGGGYARLPITFGAVSGNTISNSNVIEFTNMPNVTVTHWAIKDAVTGGEQKLFGTFSPTIPFLAGDIFRLTAGQLTIPLTGV